MLRRLTRKINWAATQTRPDVAYTVVELSMNFKKACLEDLKKANKAINRLKGNPVKVTFPKIGGNLEITVFSDGAFTNLPDKILSGSGHIVFITGSAGEGAAPIAWTSNKVKRVVESTPAAEALSLQEAIAYGSYLRAVVAEMVDVDKNKIPIKAYKD